MAGDQIVMSVLERKQAVESALKAFASQPLYQAGMGLLNSLGYRSDRTLMVSGLKAFRDTLDQRGRLKDEVAKTSEWVGVEFLRQITSEDVSSSAQGTILFQKQFMPTEIRSYVFVSVELKRDSYTRTELSQITRAVNRVFAMPAMLLFKHGAGLTLAVISRRLSKRDQIRDILEKVTLVKDINYLDPLRAHIEILHDLSLEALYEDFYFQNFAGLHQAWEKRLASYALNERFYREVAHWYFWALKAPGVVLPRSIKAIRNPGEREKQRSTFFIRLLTRLIFCWFLQEKGLLPRDLFRRRVAEELLKDTSPLAGTYYKAFLQNLFFATLNQEQERRGWCQKYPGSRHGNRGVTNLWRYQNLLTSPAHLEALLRDRIPFVNGDLFGCLDDTLKNPNVRLDDFSEEKDNNLCLPNELFFGEEREVDLSAVYEDARRKKEKVSGLIAILSRYKFTVEENTPLEEEIALDPELLGKVLENLLASYNEDTRTTARKALGAFFTPRKIVSYMVDEALISYLTTRVPSVPEATIRVLFAPDAEAPPDLSSSQKASLIKAIGSVKILDPACGSGAFPMGVLHRLVALLQKLDPDNESWKRDRLAEAEKYDELLHQANAPRAELAEVEARIEDIHRSFDTRFHALDFARKLYLIENCIYGVDIQPIACQIAKLRFFIALIVDQHMHPNTPNLGVRPLPNLETKIVAADSLTTTMLGRLSLINEAGGQMEMLSPGEMESGFDIVIGNPPYVRIQTLKQQNPKLVEFYKQHYESAKKGNYDLYVVFVEVGLNFLKPDGHLAYIMPHKFFNAQYGESLRALLAKGRHLRHAVHFGDQQVFPGATNYVCLLFLARAGAESCRFVHADDLALWLETFQGTEGECPAQAITEAEWNFAVGRDSSVFERLKGFPHTLGQVAARISQGIRTSANEIYVLDVEESDETYVYVHSRQLDREVTLERKAVLPFLLGREIKPFLIQPSRKVVVIPYRDRNGRAELVPLGEIERHTPRLYSYLLANRHDLEARENGRMKTSGWYGFIYPKNIEVMSEPKLIVPDIADHASFALDENGEYAFTSGYGITLGGDAGVSLKFVLGLVNSHPLDFFWRKVSTPLRGGFYRYFTQFIAQLPIASATQKQEALVVRLVEYLLWLNRCCQAHTTEKTARDTLMLGYWEQVLNGLVYELYFPEELHARGLCLFDLVQQASLPALDGIPEPQRLSRLRKEFERVYDLQHPLRAALHDLQTVEEVRIIEGKA
jgi:type I restriction-modification system DNA methylase subunit